jgi:hypothetical protein
MSQTLLSTISFCGAHVMVVSPGTVVRDERSGEEIVVDDTSAARKGSVVYCTQAVFEVLKVRTMPAAGNA